MTPADRNAVVFYRGPSGFNGEPIVGVLTGLAYASRNTKTGDLLQAWILREDMSPTEAIRRGADSAICGNCALRGDGVHGRACYVTYWQGPERVYSRLADRPFVDPSVLSQQIAGAVLRLGAYGDPAMVPFPVWWKLLRRTAGWIGYTQQWRRCARSYSTFLMASVASEADQQAAVSRGWRTFRIRKPDAPLLAGEVVCPASREAGHKATCADCLLCQGSINRRANPVIIAHGKLGNLRALGVKGWTPQGSPKGSKNKPKVINLELVS